MPLPPERRSGSGAALGRAAASLGRSALPLRCAALNGLPPVCPVGACRVVRPVSLFSAPAEKEAPPGQPIRRAVRRRPASPASAPLNQPLPHPYLVLLRSGSPREPPPHSCCSVAPSPCPRRGGALRRCLVALPRNRTPSHARRPGGVKEGLYRPAVDLGLYQLHWPANGRPLGSWSSGESW